MLLHERAHHIGKSRPRAAGPQGISGCAGGHGSARRGVGASPYWPTIANRFLDQLFGDSTLRQNWALTPLLLPRSDLVQSRITHVDRVNEREHLRCKRCSDDLRSLERRVREVAVRGEMTVSVNNHELRGSLDNPVVERDSITVQLGRGSSPLSKDQIETCAVIGTLLRPADEVCGHCRAVPVDEAPDAFGGRAATITMSIARATLLDLERSPINLPVIWKLRHLVLRT